MNKLGKISPLLIVFGVIALGLIAWGVYGISNIQFGDTDESKLVTGDCDTEPTITVYGRNAENIGTIVTLGTIYAERNNDYLGIMTSGTTKFKYGDSVKLLVNTTDYINEIVPAVNVVCGDNPVTVDVYATSTNTFRIFNTNGEVVTDSATAGAVNQSAITASGSLTVWIDSTSDESTGDLLIVIEGSNTTEIDKIKLSGLGGATDADVPEFYSPTAAGSIVEAFNVPALIDGESKSGTLYISAETGETIGTDGTVIYVTAYSKQAFVDNDGSFKTDVEDKDGGTEYEDTWDYDFVVGALT